MNIFGMFFVTWIRIRIYSGSYFEPNTNTNIFVILKWTEYKYSNILGKNILILFDKCSNIPERGHVYCYQSYKFNTIIPATTSVSSNIIISLITYLRGLFLPIFTNFCQFSPICIYFHQFHIFSPIFTYFHIFPPQFSHFSPIFKNFYQSILTIKGF